MTSQQQTIKKELKLEGVGLHTGREVAICLRPGPVDSGIVFKRTDLPHAPELRICVGNLKTDNMSGRCSIVGVGDVSITTIEHLMAALYGLEIDNVAIDINGPEVPGMDGSALGFIEEIQKTGIEPQEAPRQFIFLKNPVSVSAGNASISIFPCEEFRVTYVLDYDHPALRSQVFNFTLEQDAFIREIAPARTFCLEQEAAALKEAGFGKGANYQNTLVMGEKGPIENEMRLNQECLRHKMLDLIGDLSFLGKPVKGHIFAIRSGHYLNACLVKAISEQNERTKFPKALKAGGQKAFANIEQIMNALPHRYPFLLVDRITEMEPGQRAVGIKNLTVNELFFQGHFPQKPIMPGVLMIEAMAQVGGFLLKSVERHQDQVGLFMAVNNAKFRRTAHPGDQIVMEIEVIRDRARMASIRGVSRVDEEVIVEADMMFSFLAAEKLFD